MSGFRLEPVHSFYTRSAPPCLLRARLRHKVSGAPLSRIGQISRDLEHVLSTSLYPNWGHVTQQWWRHLQRWPAFTIYGQSCNASRLSIQHLLIWAWAGWAVMWHRLPINYLRPIIFQYNEQFSDEILQNFSHFLHTLAAKYLMPNISATLKTQIFRPH